MIKLILKPDNKVHWAPDGSNVGPMNHAFRVFMDTLSHVFDWSADIPSNIAFSWAVIRRTRASGPYMNKKKMRASAFKDVITAWARPRAPQFTWHVIKYQTNYFIAISPNVLINDPKRAIWIISCYFLRLISTKQCYLWITSIYPQNLTEIRAWVNNHGHGFMWDVIIPSCSNFNDGVVKPSLKLGHG